LNRELSSGVNYLQDKSHEWHASSSIPLNIRRIFAGVVDMLLVVMIVPFLVEKLGQMIHGVDFHVLDHICGATCDPEDLQRLFGSFWEWIDKDASGLKVLHDIGKHLLSDLAELAGVCAVTCILAGLILLCSVLFLYGQTPGKILMGLVSVNAKDHSASHSLLRLLLTIAPIPATIFLYSTSSTKEASEQAMLLLGVYPLYAINILVGSEHTVIDHLMGTSVVDSSSKLEEAFEKSKSDSEGSAKHHIIHWFQGNPAAAGKPSKSSSKNAVAKGSLEEGALTSFFDRPFQDLWAVAAYAAFTYYLFHDRPLALHLDGKSLPAGYGMFTEVSSLIMHDHALVLPLFAIAYVCCTAVAYSFSMAAYHLFQLTYAGAVGWLLYEHTIDTLAAGVPKVPELDFHPDTLLENPFAIVKGMSRPLVAISIVHIWFACSKNIKFSCEVMRTTAIAVFSNPAQVLVSFGLELVFKLYMLALILNSVSGTSNLASVRWFVDPYSVHLLWTFFAARGVLLMATANCTAKWYYREGPCGKYNTVTRALHASASSCIKQLGTALIGGAVMVLVQFVKTIRDQIRTQYDKLKWGLATAVVKIVLFIVMWILGCLAAILERFCYTMYALGGITGKGAIASSSMAASMMSGHFFQLVGGSSIIAFSNTLMSTTFVVSCYLATSYSWGAVEARFAATSESKQAALTMATYLGLCFGWFFLGACDTIVLLALDEGDQHSSSSGRAKDWHAPPALRDAILSYKEGGAFGFSKYLLRLVFFAVGAFFIAAFVQDLAQKNGGDDKIYVYGNIGLQLLLFAFVNFGF
jgi:hypothetical protein